MNFRFVVSAYCSLRKLIVSKAVSRYSPANPRSVTRSFERTLSIRYVRSAREIPGMISALKVTFISGRAQILVAGS